MKHLFTHHPNSVGETYWQHLCFALNCSMLMLLAGMAALIHAFFPFLLLKTSSDILYKLLHKFENGPRAKLFADHEKERR